MAVAWLTIPKCQTLKSKWAFSRWEKKKYRQPYYFTGQIRDNALKTKHEFFGLFPASHVLKHRHMGRFVLWLQFNNLNRVWNEMSWLLQVAVRLSQSQNWPEAHRFKLKAPLASTLLCLCWLLIFGWMSLLIISSNTWWFMTSSSTSSTICHIFVFTGSNVNLMQQQLVYQSKNWRVSIIMISTNMMESWSLRNHDYNQGRSKDLRNIQNI